MKRARYIVSEILDHGLAKSTWQEQHPKAYKDLLTYREDLIGSFESVEPKEYHFFTSSAAHWRTHSSLYQCLRSQKKADNLLKNFKVKGCNVYKVPGPENSDYDIDNYTPQVEGTEWIHYEEY